MDRGWGSTWVKVRAGASSSGRAGAHAGVGAHARTPASSPACQPTSCSVPSNRRADVGLLAVLPDVHVEPGGSPHLEKPDVWLSRERKPHRPQPQPSGVRSSAPLLTSPVKPVTACRPSAPPSCPPAHVSPTLLARSLALAQHQRAFLPQSVRCHVKRMPHVHIYMPPPAPVPTLSSTPALATRACPARPASPAAPLVHSAPPLQHPPPLPAAAPRAVHALCVTATRCTRVARPEDVVGG